MFRNKSSAIIAFHLFVKQNHIMEYLIRKNTSSVYLWSCIILLVGNQYQGCIRQSQYRGFGLCSKPWQWKCPLPWNVNTDTEYCIDEWNVCDGWIDCMGTEDEVK